MANNDQHLLKVQEVKAIEKVPRPTTIGEIRRFLGMVNQMSKINPHMANVTNPLRDLLTKGSAWVWEDTQERAFQGVE